MSSVSLQGKQIVFCLPGAYYSGRFMMNMIKLHSYLLTQDATVRYEQHYRPLIHYSRHICLAPEPITRTPFRGELYDYMMWIDSDIVFTVEDFNKLVNMDKDIATGWYAAPVPPDGKLSTSVYDYIDAGQNVSMPVDELTALTEPFEIASNGLGWVLIKSGVVEKMSFPWFVPKLLSLNGKQYATSEDTLFFVDAHLAGFKIWVDPTCRVGHEKIVVL